ncbi:MAG: YwaF family protein [Lachnospiraceae bacterium]|nr:YwaF family protein [Lachnospiraceae bacterium]
MKDFFAYMPEGNFKTLNLAHILIIVFGLAAIAVSCILLRKLERGKVEKILFVCAIMGLVADPIYWIWELAVTKTIHCDGSLPLFYCSLFYFTLAIGAFCKKRSVRQTCYAYLATMNIFAGLMGLIMNTNLNYYSVWSFVGIRSLLYHILMLFVSCLIWTTGYYKPEIRDLYRFFIPLAILFVPALIVDKIWGFDYCYLNGGRGTVLETVSAAMPNFVYIFLLYLTIYVAVVCVFYIPTVVKFVKQKKKVRDGGEE